MSHQEIETYEDQQKKRLKEIGNALWEMRFAEGKNQDEFGDCSVTRRQIQRGEYGSNLTLVQLFKLIDCFDYTLEQFFHGME